MFGDYEPSPAFEKFLLSEICELVHFQFEAAVWNQVMLHYAFVVLRKNSPPEFKHLPVGVGSAVLGDELEELREGLVVHVVGVQEQVVDGLC